MQQTAQPYRITVDGMVKSSPNTSDRKPLPNDISALQHATHIDRRTCHREVPMKVICLGPSRSGTASMRQALVDLGYKDCYHFASASVENPPDLHMWTEALEAKYLGKGKSFTRDDWDQLLGHCQAVTDAPCFLFWRELIEAYPDAKIVVSTRDSPDQWARSVLNTIAVVGRAMMNPSNSLFDRLLRSFMPQDVGGAGVRRSIHENSPMFQAMWDDVNNDTGKLQEWYTDYMKELEETIPEEKILFMNIREGWDPLCKFLGDEVPEAEFPRSNDTARFVKNSGEFRLAMTRAAYWEMGRTFGGLALGLSAFGYAVARWRSWL